MLKRIYFLLVFVIICVTGQTQTRFPVVYIDSSTYFVDEPSICVNPKNTNQIIAGTVINNYYWSNNSGVTWNGGILYSTWGVWGDPAITVDTNGNYYYIHLSYGNGGGWWIDRIVCNKSTDGGQTYDVTGTYMGLNTSPKRQDKAGLLLTGQTIIFMLPGRNLITMTPNTAIILMTVQSFFSQNPLIKV